ncbi:hypothetical protein, partial [Escherichia coli]|uniref:hypothetical protein n=1 Tax=Escherichia coli TaxID=562 RepID=UPI0032DA056F
MKTSKCGSKEKRVKIRLQVETVLQADSRRVESWQNAKILVREYLVASRNRRSEISAALKCLFCPSFSTHYKSIISSSNPKLGCGFGPKRRARKGSSHLLKELKKGKSIGEERSKRRAWRLHSGEFLPLFTILKL